MHHRLALLVAALALVAGVAATVSGSATQAQARWVITDLGTLGGQESEARDINNRGQIVGWATRRGSMSIHPVLWEHGSVKTLPAFDSAGGTAEAINDRGVVVGDSNGHAVAWQDGRIAKLARKEPADYAFYEANAISNGGTVVGSAVGDSRYGEALTDRPMHAFVFRQGTAVPVCANQTNESFIGSVLSVWSGRPPAAALNDRGWFVGECDLRAFVYRSGNLVRLRVPRGAQTSGATAINEEGVIVGFAGRRAYVWRGRGAESLAVPAGSDWSEARGINDAGDIVGALRKRRMRAALWRGARVIQIGPAHRESKGVVINERGQVLIDTSFDDGLDEQAYVWDRGVLATLPTLGGSTSRAIAINENNQIVGWSETKSGARHAVLWTLKRG